MKIGKWGLWIPLGMVLLSIVITAVVIPKFITITSLDLWLYESMFAVVLLSIGAIFNMIEMKQKGLVEKKNKETAKLDFSTCPSCNGHIATSDKYCSKCFFPLNGYCPKCGENLRLSDRREGIHSDLWVPKYCPNCAAKICEDS